MQNEVVVSELNAFLKGRYMGIRAYEHFIEKLDDPQIKGAFQIIQQDHKLHAILIAEQIQNLGGVPVDDEGFVGSIVDFFNQFTTPNSTEKIVKMALKGEAEYGIQLSEEIVRGDLDPESNKLVHDILEHDRKHVVTLKNLVH